MLWLLVRHGSHLGRNHQSSLQGTTKLSEGNPCAHATISHTPGVLCFPFGWFEGLGQLTKEQR